MTLSQDLRFGVRMLARQPGFTAVVALTLAVGIGVNTAVFTLVNAVLFRGLPFEQSDRVMYLSSNNHPKNRTDIGVSYPDLKDWRAQSKAFKGIAGFAPMGMVIAGDGGAPERYGGPRVTSNFFRLIGQKPMLGRDFLPEEDRAGAASVCIIGYRIWEARYGRDPNILGKSIRVNDAATTIIGVMPKGMKFPTNADLWLPLVPTGNFEKRDDRNVMSFGRLADGVSLAQARAELDAVARRLENDYPKSNQGIVVKEHPMLMLVPSLLSSGDIAECPPRRGIRIGAPTRIANFIGLNREMRFNFGSEVFVRPLLAPPHAHASDSPVRRISGIALPVRILFALERATPDPLGPAFDSSMPLLGSDVNPKLDQASDPAHARLRDNKSGLKNLSSQRGGVMDSFDLYQTIGGAAVCRELSEAFYARVARDPILRPLFPGKTLRCAIEAFTAFLAQFLGGPAEDAQDRWWLSLRQSHLRFKIGPQERDAWMKNMIEALDQIQIDEPQRGALRSLFEQASMYLINTGQAHASAEGKGVGPSDGVHQEMARKWSAQRVIDEAVDAIHRGDADRAIALAEGAALRTHFTSNQTVFTAFLAVMIARGDNATLGYVREKLLADPALAQVHYSGRTLLHAAAAAGNLAIVELLLQLGAGPDTADAGGHTPLYCLANECQARGGAKTVGVLVKAGARVDACGGVKRCTALHMAARRGNAGVAQTLLDCGADIERKDSIGDTALRRAVNCNKTEVAALLVARGADIHSRGSKDLTPLSAARTDAMRRVLQARSEA